MREFPFGLVLTALFSLLLAGACSGPPTLQTQSLSRAPSVDGTLSEWGGALTRVGDGSVSMSAAPTDSLLYLAFVIPDRSLIRSVAARGLVVWVDPTGKQKHTYGVQYPLGLRAQRPDQKTADASTSGGANGPSMLDQMFPSDLAIIRNDTIRRRMPARFSSALRAHATLNTGVLIYEVAIPVNRSAADVASDGWKHGLHTPLGRSVAIGLRTPDLDEDSDVANQSQGVPSVTGRGGQGRSPRGRQRGQQGQRPSPSQPPTLPTLDLWARVVSADGQ